MLKTNFTLEDFATIVKEAIQEYYGEGEKVSINQVMKNNGVELVGISVMETSKNISPTIYLNSFYEEYQEGRGIGEIIDQVIHLYEASRPDESLNMDFFLQYEGVKKKIVFKLINFQKNEKLLADVPHVKYLDLAIVFYCMMLSDQFGNATILVHNSHLSLWQVSLEQIFQDAKENTPRILGHELKNMDEILQEMFQDSEETEIDRQKEQRSRKKYRNEEPRRENGVEGDNLFAEETKQIRGKESQLGEEYLVKGKENAAVGKENSVIGKENRVEKAGMMYVLSNHTRINGAASILYEGLLGKIADRLECDLFILPSSVHEVIVIPEKGDEDYYRLSEMVREVNETQLSPEEVLADHAYYYSREMSALVEIA